jgi:hypothetical protein
MPVYSYSTRCRFHGSKEERQEIVDNQLRHARLNTERDWDVCITTYEVVNLEKSALTKIQVSDIRFVGCAGVVGTVRCCACLFACGYDVS